MSKVPHPQEAEIVTLYQSGKGRGTIARLLGVNEDVVRRTIKRKGIMRGREEGARLACTKYHVDEAFFESIDTLEKCWALGWMFSDGYNKTDVGDVRIGLNDRDEEVLIKLGDLMGNTRPLCREPKHVRSTLIISRRKMSDDLAKLGCIQAKSHIVQFPSTVLDTRAKTCAFLRGIVDGDGSIVTCWQNKLVPSITLTIACASSLFVGSLKTIFTDYWHLSGYVGHTKELPVSGIRFCGSAQNLRNMLAEIYDSPLSLARKYKQSKEAIAVLDEMIRTRYQLKLRNFQRSGCI